MTDCLVFVAGEGPSDIGWLARGPSQRPQGGRRPPATTGFVPPLLERVAGEKGIALRFDGRKTGRLGRADPERFETEEGVRDRGLEDLFLRARQAAALAESLDADLIVYVTDVDKTPGKRANLREGKRLRGAKLRAIEEGLKAGSALPYVVGVPMRMIEAWALGDLAAFRHVSGHANASVPGKSPEHLWGAKTDPSSNYPKRVIERALGQSATADLLARIACEADLDAIAASCPISFAPFLADLRAQAAQCASERR